MSRLLQSPPGDEPQVANGLATLLRGTAGDPGEPSGFKPEDQRPWDINRALAAYQDHAEWTHRPLIRELHRWDRRFIAAFELGIPEPPLSVDWLRVYVLGHFRPGHNGFGLEGEGAINARHLHW